VHDDNDLLVEMSGALDRVIAAHLGVPVAAPKQHQKGSR
jgi:hypothetical protein